MERLLLNERQQGEDAGHKQAERAQHDQEQLRFLNGASQGGSAVLGRGGPADLCLAFHGMNSTRVSAELSF